MAKRDMGDIDRAAYCPRSAEAVTPADSDLSGKIYVGVFVGGAGNLAVRMAEDSANVTLVGVAAGTFLPIAVKRVASTNTTATNIVGFVQKTS